MRRLTIAAVVVLVALFLGLGAASAKTTRLTVSSPATAPRAHVPWTIVVHVSVHGRPYAKPGYRVELAVLGRDGFPVATFGSTRLAPGTFRVRVTFPGAGRWRYEIADPVMGTWYFVAPHVAA